MGIYSSKHRWTGILLTFVLTLLSQFVRAQSGSFGSTFAHTGMEMVIFGQHNFVTGSGTISAGIIGSERQPTLGLYSFTGSGSGWVAASSTAFVDGYVRTYLSGPFTFPIGDNNKYRPAAVSASSSTAPTTAAYFGVDPTLAVTSSLKGGNEPVLPSGGPFSTASKAATVGVVDNMEYWDIDGTTPARITLTWDASTPISAMTGGDLSKLTIVGWNGSQWVEIPSTVDVSSLVQTSSASAFTGSASTVSAGSITTTGTVVPNTYTVYTLAGACRVNQVTASVSSLTVCSGSPVSISYTTGPVAGGQVQWVRRASDGSPDIAGIGDVVDYPPASGTTPVSYTYIATSAETFGCTSNTVTTGVTFNPVPEVTASVCSQTICSGQTGAITFTSSLGGTTINWLRVEDGQTGTGNISQVFGSAGTYTYKVWGVSTGTSCPSSSTITCTVVVGNCCDLQASIVSTASTSCATPNGSIAITYSGSGTYKYSLNGAASQALGASPLVVSNLAPGSYTVVLSDVSSSTCNYTTQVVIPGTSLTVTASSNSPVCTASTLALSATPTEATGTVTYTWTGPNGFSSSAQNPTVVNITTAATGVYSVTATEQGGCTAISSTSVTVANQPSLTISNGLSQTICSGQSTTLVISGDGGAPVTWINSLGQTGSGTSISFAGISNVSGQPQTVTYLILANAGTCSDRQTVTITVKPAPTLQVYPVQAVVCALEQTQVTATASSPTATIVWSRTPTLPAPATGSGTGTVTANEQLPAGNYTYTFTATQNGCSSTPVISSLTVNN